jgi:hypothetical protein
VREVLTPLGLTAGLVLVVAAVAKLRSPGAAARALFTLAGRSPGSGQGAGVGVRALALGELGLGSWCVIAPGRLPGLLAAGLYCAFAAITAALARRQAACGCFGIEDAHPASLAQSAISGGLALVCLLAAVVAPHGWGWLLTRSPAAGAVVTVGVLACTYGLLLAYTELPAAWAAWRPR